MKVSDRVRSTPFFATQFPAAIKVNKGRPLIGYVKGIRKDGHVKVKWITATAVTTYHPDFVELDQ